MADGEFPSKHADEDVECELPAEVEAIRNKRAFLIDQLDPTLLVVHLHECITPADESEIKAKYEQEGRVLGALKLLEKLVRRENFWEKLLEVLKCEHIKQSHIAEALEKELQEVKNKRLKRHSEFQTERTGPKFELDKVLCYDVSIINTSNEDRNKQELHTGNADVSIINISNEDGNINELQTGNADVSIINTSNEDGNINELQTGNADVSIINTSNEDRNINEMSSSNANSKDLPLKSSLAESSHTHQVQIECLDITTAENQQDPRSYQLELAKSGQQGINSIICAPTGSGKTMVASLICESHLEKYIPDKISEHTTDSNPADESSLKNKSKIVFLVPRFAILIHVYRELQRRLPLFSIGKRSGASKIRIPLNEMMNKYDIIVVTADIFKNALINKSEKCIDIWNPTLLIFDECHHANKDSPYNQIMAEYLKCKVERKDVKLPQVIGLSASPGAGKTVSNEQARKKILTLCATLDAQAICTVPEKYEEELKKHVSIPTKKNFLVDKDRSKNPFSDIVVNTMEKIEKKLAINFGSVKKGSREYESQAQSNLREAIKCLDNDKKCLQDLTVYNQALELVKLVRMKDGCKFVAEYFREYEERESKLSDIEIYLLELYKNMVEEFEKIKELEDTYPNPKLQALKTKLLEFYEICQQKEEEFRAIIFVKTRVLTKAMQEWITEDTELCMLPAQVFTGTTVSSESGGMQHSEQNRILNLFKEGEIKILISTSVGEEGIDIPACNMCIRYNHVTNEIAMVQSRGRARKHESVEMVIGDTATHEKDSINVLLEEKMIEGIKFVQMNWKKVKPDMDKIQTEIIKRRNKEDNKLDKLKSTFQAKDVEIHCKHCKRGESFLCGGTDVKLRGSSYILPDPRFREKMIFEDHSKKDFRERGIERILCKKCGSALGITMSDYPCLGIEGISFVIQGKGSSYKKWKKVPFTVELFE